MSVANEKLDAEIADLLDQYAALWDQQNPAGLIALWDQDDPEPFYLAEEQDDWRMGWKDVQEYWDPPGPPTAQSIRMRFDGVKARYLSDDLAFAKFWIRFDTMMKFLRKPIGSDARCSAIFRRKPEGWRLVTWAESPGTPLLYVQRLYETHAKEGEKSPVPYIQELYERHNRDDFPEFMVEHTRSE